MFSRSSDDLTVNKDEEKSVTDTFLSFPYFSIHKTNQSQRFLFYRSPVQFGDESLDEPRWVPREDVKVPVTYKRKSRFRNKVPFDFTYSRSSLGYLWCDVELSRCQSCIKGPIFGGRVKWEVRVSQTSDEMFVRTLYTDLRVHLTLEFTCGFASNTIVPVGRSGGQGGLRLGSF